MQPSTVEVNADAGVADADVLMARIRMMARTRNMTNIMMMVVNDEDDDDYNDDGDE